MEASTGQETLTLAHLSLQGLLHSRDDNTILCWLLQPMGLKTRAHGCSYTHLLLSFRILDLNKCWYSIKLAARVLRHLTECLLSFVEKDVHFFSILRSILSMVINTSKYVDFFEIKQYC